MSRESDSSSSGTRKGSGAAAYPPGTPPYGSRQYPSPNPAQEAQGSGDGEARAAAQPEEPKTETTLTTRIRINIPGSRPIPPVVMRTPVGEEGVPNQRSADDPEGADGPAGPDAAPAGPGAAGPARGEHGEPSANKPEKKKEDRTSDWFAPRKGKGNTSTGSTPQPPVPPAATPPAPGPAAAEPFGAEPFGAEPFGAGAFAPEASAAPSAAETTQPFPAPDFSAPESPFSAPETTQQFPAPSLGGGAGADLPYFTDTPQSGFPGVAEPSGPTTGPVTGGMRLPTRSPGATQPPLGGGAGLAGQPPTPPNGSPLSGSLGATTGASPAPSAGPFDGLGGKPGLDSAADRPLFRDPDPTPGGGVPAEHVSGETLVSGIPVVPPAENRPGSPFPPPGTGPAAPAPSDEAGAPASSPKPPAAPAAARPKKKGRSKLVLAVGALVFVGCGAYGAGLVMNHADVPNGTTVLGVDIGGTSKETAVQKLDTALEGRTTAPLKVSVDGQQKQIKPSVAGLTLDTEATVRGVAGRDYNPITVIGSLFGGTHEADPVVTVDEEKLKDALERLAGTSGTAREGTIEFKPGKAVAVYGKAGKGLDVDKAVAAVDEAFRQRAATGENKVITLPVVTKQPQISNAEVDRKMRTFAQPAMSDFVKVQTDPAHSLPLSPQNSLWKILSVRVVDGKLVEHYDLKALKELYGGLFDGVLIQRGNGSKQPVAPTDVAVALGQALKGKTPAERIGIIETNGN
ncbi:peptidoglycan binding domain-containing protein [Streptomyces sp. NBS 14/10]|uniref:peptidoglycan binding domain-containing protein n=1 Tax=Streptomyces sp. NBS 14/10 TaxID=1945643 RepID=UPI000D1A2EDE|nr:peptidoglycan binding domain-containing protein [Streptomyces sp. NBS 14/10]KAK1181900.1 peptidoglycan binding domain-containing protein [Streptomyces sp. NBS 14/10]